MHHTHISSVLRQEFYKNVPVCNYLQEQLMHYDDFWKCKL